jgi:hypothetical protein
MADRVEQAIWHVRYRSTGGLILSGIPVTLNFHPDTIISDLTTIELLARDGIYRSQFETGTSNGGLTAYPGGDRWCGRAAYSAALTMLAVAPTCRCGLSMGR